MTNKRTVNKKRENVPFGQFEKEYWHKNYSEPEEMDGIANKKEHAQYLKYLMAVDYIDISTIIDFGVGLGFLFQEILKTFKPHHAVAIDPSVFALKKAEKRVRRPVLTTKLEFYNMDLLSWSLGQNKGHPVFDLGLCTSVFQYLSEKEIDLILPVLAKKVKFLYFTVPTNIEIRRMKDEIKFVDPYSYSRTQAFYKKKLGKYFTFVGRRLLESKFHFNQDNTFFSEQLFRF